MNAIQEEEEEKPENIFYFVLFLSISLLLSCFLIMFAYINIESEKYIYFEIVEVYNKH